MHAQAALLPPKVAQIARPARVGAHGRAQGWGAPRSQNSLSIQVSCASSKHSAGLGSPSLGWCPAAPLALSLEPKPGVLGAEPLGLPPRRMTLYVLSYMHTSLCQECAIAENHRWPNQSDQELLQDGINAVLPSGTNSASCVELHTHSGMLGD